MNLFELPYLFYVEEQSSFRERTMDICGYDFGVTNKIISTIETTWTVHEWKSFKELNESNFYKVRLK